MSVRPGKHDEGEKPEIPQRTPYDPVDPDQSPVPLPPDSNPQPTAPVREPVEPTPIEDPTPPEPTRLYNYPQMGRLTVSSIMKWVRKPKLKEQPN